MKSVTAAAVGLRRIERIEDRLGAGSVGFVIIDDQIILEAAFAAPGQAAAHAIALDRAGPRPVVEIMLNPVWSL